MRSDEGPSVEELENLGRIRLSKSFYMREFLYSEVATRLGIVNYPDNVEIAISHGKRLCEEILEPLHACYGRISVRSGYRSSALNAACHEQGFNCVENQKAFGRHIWDVCSDRFGYGAMACVVIPSVNDAVASGVLIDEFAYWVDANLPYCFMSVFAELTAINICWSEIPCRNIYSRISPEEFLFKQGSYIGKHPESRQSKKLAAYVSEWKSENG